MTPLTKAAAATKTATTAIRARDDAIRAAHASGVSIRKIAAEIGLSPQRVHQILHGR